MAAAEDISLLSRNIKSSMGEVSGEFEKLPLIAELCQK
jgi:hypothetical protein